jgi:hypothetical protein
MIYNFSTNYAERLFYFFKRLFILLIIVQFVCIIAINEDTTLTIIFFSMLGGVTILSLILERISRKMFPAVTINNGIIHLEAGGKTIFKFPANQVLKVYCDVAFSLNSAPLSYSKGIIFRAQPQDIEKITFYLDRLSANKVINIQSLVEYYKSTTITETTGTTKPINNYIIIENKSLRTIMALCIGAVVAFWSYIGFLISQQENHEEMLFLCIGVCLLMIVPILLAHSNSLVKIEYNRELHLTTFLGKQVTFAANEILKIDTQKATLAGENRVHYLNIQLKNETRKKYKILLSSEEEKAKFHKLSELLKSMIYAKNGNR